MTTALSGPRKRVTPAATKLQLGSLVLEPDNRGVTYHNRPISLTQQEFELLHHMAMHPGQLLTRGQLLRDVWGYESDTDASRTVDYHIRSLRRKLGDDAAKPLLIETVHGSGYRLLGSA